LIKSKSKYILLSIIVVVLMIVIVLILENHNYKKELSNKGLVGLGKTFTVEVLEDSNYEVFNEGGQFDMWDGEERSEMIIYMKENDLVLKTGIYNINQAFTFERAVEEFSFVKNE